MKTVYKYSLLEDGRLQDHVTISLPVKAEILHVGIDPAYPDDPTALRLWAMVDTDNDVEPRMFRIAGTGHEVQGDVKHIGSMIVAKRLVWHVFEVLL